MVLLSGEVETTGAVATTRTGSTPGSGWFCYPGKLKPRRSGAAARQRRGGFRMVLLSGEVETRPGRPSPGGDHLVPDGFAIRGS